MSIITQTINSHLGHVREIQVLSDEKVVSCSQDKTIKMWNFASTTCIINFESDYEIDSIYVH